MMQIFSPLGAQRMSRTTDLFLRASHNGAGVKKKGRVKSDG
jgi:hypothetical protein